MKTKARKQKIKVYDLVEKKPVARFYYQGGHSHPIRRTVLIIEETDTTITGYEFRCGNDVRTREEALQSIKTFRKDRIPKWGDYSRLRMTSRTFLKDPEKSTLERCWIVTMFSEGA
tara:strand:- start:282 stop:629 length:348 start_codon:yes stop_codon:yes gene_type:complete